MVNVKKETENKTLVEKPYICPYCGHTFWFCVDKPICPICKEDDFVSEDDFECCHKH